VPSDGARTARLVTLIAGHSFVFAKWFDHLDTITAIRTAPLATWAIISMPLVGIATAYVALSGEAKSRAAKTMEYASLFLLTLLAAGFLWIAAGKLNLINIPHSP
jgi:hypothetical protein